MALGNSGIAILPQEAIKSHEVLKHTGWERAWHGLGVGFGGARE